MISLISNIAQMAGQAAAAGHVDKVSVDRIALLHPKLRVEAYHIYMDHVVPALNGKAFCRFDLTFRTFAQQQALFDQGRTKPGPIVTKARAGQSFHCYGLAIDYFLVTDRDGDGNYTKAEWDTVHDFDGDGQADWIEVEKAFAGAGWEWGGTWSTIKDMPHVQRTFGYHWSELLALHNAGKVDRQGYVLI